jgi:hypothetical protein
MAFCGPVDTFPGPSFAAHWPASYGTTTIESGRAKISSGSDYAARTSATGNSLVGNEMLVEIDSNGSTSGEWYFMLRTDSGADPGFGRNGSTLFAYTTTSQNLGTYSQTTHRWVRIRESGGTIFWETSPDGATWTTRHSEASSGYTLTSGYLELGAGNSITYYDNLNAPPAGAAPVTVAGSAAVAAPSVSASAAPTSTVVAATAQVGAPAVSIGATPTPTVLDATAAVLLPNVIAGSNVNAVATLIDAPAAVGAPTAVATAVAVTSTVAFSAGVLLPNIATGTGAVDAAAGIVRARGLVLAPTVVGVDDAMLYPGLLKVGDGAVFRPGRLTVGDGAIFRPGQLGVYRSAPSLVRRMVDDATLPHEALLDEVPEFFDWGLGPRLNPVFNRAVGPDNTWTAAAPWGQIYAEAGFTPTGNTHCVVRRLSMATLSVTTGTWTTRLVAEDATEMEGFYFLDDFSGNATSPDPLGVNAEGYLTGIPGTGYNMHWYPIGRVAITNQGDIGGVVGWFEAKLETVPGQPDDIATTRYLAGASGDWWENETIAFEDPSGGGSGTHNGDWAIGRHRFLTADWQTFTGHTLTERQIRENPPPITLAG